MLARIIRQHMMDYPKVKYQRVENSTTIDIESHSGANRSKSEGNLPCPCNCIKVILCLLVTCVDGFVSGVIQLVLFVYRKIAKRYPQFLEIYKREQGDIECLENEIQRLTQQGISYTDCIQRLHDDLESERQKIKTLEDEKQDALTRLSELVSVRLRDNNPNIVDLNDQCRPTKLAEMFSELYDNEWTNAFSVLEEHGEERAIVILLNIVTRAYGFCQKRVAVSWEVLKDWYLDMKIPGAQQASKWLKDSRKANIKNKIPKVGKEYEELLLATCKEPNAVKVVQGKDINSYITKCIELCLLMVTTDPPVVLKCPEWPTEMKKDDKDSSVQELSHDITLDRESKRERDLFDKDLFKEYTIRGKYLDFVVWPALFLHDDGPLLCKGIAQGSSEKYRDSKKRYNVECKIA